MRGITHSAYWIITDEARVYRAHASTVAQLFITSIMFSGSVGGLQFVAQCRESTEGACTEALLYVTFAEDPLYGAKTASSTLACGVCFDVEASDVILQRHVSSETDQILDIRGSSQYSVLDSWCWV